MKPLVQTLVGFRLLLCIVVVGCLLGALVALPVRSEPSASALKFARFGAATDDDNRLVRL